MINKKVAFVGLSHLGIIYSHAAAKKNFSVTAIDSNNILLENLKKNNFPFGIIKKIYYFESKRWDIVTEKNQTIKLPIKNYTKSLKNF